MSIITDEMDRLKKASMEKVKAMGLDINMTHFELGYAYGMDDSRRMQETINRLAEEVVNDERD